MELKSMPEQFSSVFGELIYRYGPNSTLPAYGAFFEVEISGGSPPEVLGVKKFALADEIGVNVAGCLRRKLSPAPICAQGSGFYEDAGRTVMCAVKYNGENCAPRLYTAALEDLSDGRQLTRLPLHRDIARDERDEFSFVTAGGLYYASFEVRGERQMMFDTDEYVAGEGICTFVADMGWVMSRVEQAGGDPSRCRSVHARIFGNGSETAHIIYILRDNCASAVRLCWLNSLGGMDNFTFQSVVSEQIRASKDRIISEEEYVTVASTAEKIIEINSGYQPEAVLSALSEIVASSRVWMCRGGGFVPLDVMSDSAIVKSEDLGCLKLKVRESNVINYQTF